MIIMAHISIIPADGSAAAEIAAALPEFAVDAGGLRRARELEALGFLQISLAAAEKVSWTGGFAVAA